MKNNKLDFFPEVFQAVAGRNFTVYAYMNDGQVRLYDMKPIIKRGGVFKVLENENTFREKLTVLNNSIAWDLSGDRDESRCIDIDPFQVFQSPVVSDFPEDDQTLDEMEAIYEAKADSIQNVVDSLN